MIKDNPIAFYLMEYKNSYPSADILLIKEDPIYIRLTESQKGLLHNIYVKYCFNKKIKIPSNFFTDIEILFIYKFINANELIKSKELLQFFKKLSNNSPSKLNLLTVLYSIILTIDPDFLFDEPINYFLEVFGSAKSDKVPFYFMYLKNGVNTDKIKCFLRGHREKIVFDGKIARFCLDEGNYHAFYLLCNEFKSFNFLNEFSYFADEVVYYIKNRMKDYNEIFFECTKMMFKENPDNKENIPLKFKIISFFLKNRIELKLDDSFIDWLIVEARKNEELHEDRFCNNIVRNINDCIFLHNNGLSLDMSKDELNYLNLFPLEFILSHNKNACRNLTSVFMINEHNEEENNNSILNIHKIIKDYNKEILPSFTLGIEEMYPDAELILNNFHSFILPDELINRMNACENVDDFAELIFFKRTNHSRKSLDLLFINGELKADRVIWAYTLSKNNMNYDLIINLLRDNILFRFATLELATNERLINRLSEIISKSKIFDLLNSLSEDPGRENKVNAFDWELEDLLKQLDFINNLDQSLFAKELVSKNRRKIKTMSDLHDFLSEKVIKLIEQKDYPLEQNHIQNLDKINFENYTIHVPKSNKELIDCGSDLKICVGDGFYATEIVEHKIFIIFLMEGSQIRFCIEIKRANMSIKQAMSRNNIPMIKKDLNALEEIIRKTII